MRLPEIAIFTGGVLTLLVFVGHTAFGRLLRWRGDLERMHPLNRQVLYTIHLALTLLLLPGALVSLLHPEQLARANGLGGVLAASYAAFWGWRLVWQIVYFGPRAREVGPRWQRIHAALVVLLVVQTAAYGGPVALAWLSGS